MNPIITLDLVFLTLSHRLDVTKKQWSQYPTILAATEILKKKLKRVQGSLKLITATMDFWGKLL